MISRYAAGDFQCRILAAIMSVPRCPAPIESQCQRLVVTLRSAAQLQSSKSQWSYLALSVRAAQSWAMVVREISYHGDGEAISCLGCLTMCCMCNKLGTSTSQWYKSYSQQDDVATSTRTHCSYLISRTFDMVAIGFLFPFLLTHTTALVLETMAGYQRHHAIHGQIQKREVDPAGWTPGLVIPLHLPCHPYWDTVYTPQK